MSTVSFITFFLLIALFWFNSIIECGLIGLAGLPVETAWCATLGRESTHCPGGYRG
uniref:Inner membrane protein n=1 Tax=Meloidogyne hapla TaxID=6305 RepID=A0A1I8B800_MELHA